MLRGRETASHDPGNHSTHHCCLQETTCLPSGSHGYSCGERIMNIFYIIGVVVVVAVILGYLGLA
jgi:hypothetical protein